MIVVVSSDAQLHCLSREVLSDLGQEHLLRAPGGTIDSVGDEDICILDWSADAERVASSPVACKGRVIYAVEREQISELPAVIPMSTVGVLLKPINRSALRLSLKQAIDVCAFRTVGGAGLEQDDLLQSLLHAYLRLQEHESDRAAFLARVLHDFRAPLTAINGYCGLFLDESLGPLRPKQRETIVRMNRSASRLSRLATSLFHLIAHDRAAADLRMSESSIRSAIDQAVKEVRATCEDRDITLSVQVEDPVRPLVFDAARIEEVVVHLLENAIRFSLRHGRIELLAYPWCTNGEPVPNAFRVDVRDFGPRIADDVLPQIFEEVYVSTDSGDRSSGGLGLAICKLIVKGHSGAISATSGPEGTVLSFVLPSRSKDNVSQSEAAFAG